MSISLFKNRNKNMILEKYGVLALDVNTLARQHVSSSITAIMM